jgi:hypothetical protein
MFAFGEKVVINAPNLKSHNKMGIYVGQKVGGIAKVYLEEPIVTEKNNVIACITIAEDKLRRYAENERDRIIERLDFLTHRSTELQAEMQAIDDEIFELEVKLMNVGG